MDFYEIDESFAEQLLDADLPKIKEPLNLYGYLVTNLREEVHQKSSTDEFFRKVEDIKEKMLKFSELSQINYLFTIVFIE